MPADEARLHIAAIAGPQRLGDSVQRALERVARLTGLGERRVRGIWNREARTIRAEEMDRLRAAARDARAEEDARHEYDALVSRLAAVEAALGLSGAEPRGAGGDAGREADRGLDRSVAGGS